MAHFIGNISVPYHPREGCAVLAVQTIPTIKLKCLEGGAQAGDGCNKPST